jgi:hypothetical protein
VMADGWQTRLGGGLLLALLGGCSSNLLQTASLNLSSEASVHSDKPLDLYAKIARGALSCWFGPNGSLKKTHVFHADAAPEHKGGEVDIALHERDPAAPTPRALRAFKISIVQAAGGSRMLAENLKLPEHVAKDMRSDLARWAGGEATCSVVGTGGWGAAAGTDKAPAPVTPPKAGKNR